MLALLMMEMQTPEVAEAAQKIMEQITATAAQASSSSECPTTSVQPSLVA
jgi:hypothetical protein